MKRSTLVLMSLLCLGLLVPPCRAADEAKALHEAVRTGDIAKVKALFAGGMNANSPMIGERDRPLALAIISSKPDMVAFLIEQGADVNFKDNRDITPLMKAVGHLSLEQLQLLLNKKADLAALDSDGKTALHWAAYRGNNEAIKLFLKNGANPAISSSGWNGGLPLHQAALGGHADTISLLLADGKGSPDAQNSEGYTPLMLTANGKKAAAQRLLELKADVNKLNNDKKSALALVTERLDKAVASARQYNPKFDPANPPQAIKDLQEIKEMLIKAGGK